MQPQHPTTEAAGEATPGRIQPRILVCLFDGTSSSKSHNRTVISLLSEVLFTSSPHVTIVRRHFDGVGTSGWPIGRLLDAAFASDVNGILLEAYCMRKSASRIAIRVTKFLGSDWLGHNYQESDQIVLIGFSRGAFIARSLAGCIGLVGFPRTVNSGVYHNLFKLYISGALKQPGVADRQMLENGCYNDVNIAFLGCFDTVASLGLPTTGILSFLKPFSWWRKRFDFHKVQPMENVQYIFHAIGLHEKRAPYIINKMMIPDGPGQELHQIYYYGSHSDMGKDIAGTGNVDYPVAALLQHLKLAIPHYPFDQQALEKRFPRYANARTTGGRTRTFTPSFAVFRRSNRGLVRLLGTAPRHLGCSPPAGFRFNEEICPSVRFREDYTGVTGIEGFHYVLQNNRVAWISSDGAKVIPESEGGQFMRQLVGLA